VQPKTEKRLYLGGFLINRKHIAWSDKRCQLLYFFLQIHIYFKEKSSAFTKRGAGRGDPGSGLVHFWTMGAGALFPRYVDQNKADIDRQQTQVH
jgi:hypothetical protein